MNRNEFENLDLYPGWRTVGRIGNGSFGAVYEIERPLFETTERAALKVIHVPKDPGEIEELYNSGYDEAGVRRHCETLLQNIVREYELMVGLKDDPNVVHCEDIQYYPKETGIGWIICIKMELLTPLTKVLDRVETEEQICKFGEDMCKALAHCHSLNILHRDIKPQNIFLSRDGNFKLGDFGIAKFADQINRGTRIGTMSYMAPEVYADLPYGHAADIYSLGVALYWLLNEKRLPLVALPPACPTTKDVQDACLNRLHGYALPAPAHAGPEMSRIVLKACAYNPAERYGSAQEMLQDLQALRTAKYGSSPAVPAAAPAASEPEDQLWKAEATTVLPQQNYSPSGAALGQQPWQTSGQTQQQPQAVPAGWNAQQPAVREEKKRKLPILPIILGALALLALLVILVLLLKPGSSDEPTQTPGPPAATGNTVPMTTEPQGSNVQTSVPTEAPTTATTERPEPVTTETPTSEPAPSTTLPVPVPVWEPGIHSYEFVQSTCDWDEAWAAAREKGGHLVTFETEEEYRHVLELRGKKAPDLWYLRIGARRDDDQEAYYWRDGVCGPYGVRLDSEEAWCLSEWASGEPSLEWNGETETRCVLRYNWDRKAWELNDAGNEVSDSLNPDIVGYIIEYEPASAR